MDGKSGQLCPFGSKCRLHRHGKCELSHETPEDGEKKTGSKKDEWHSLQSGVGSGNPTVQAKSLFASVTAFGMASQNSKEPYSYYRDDEVMASDVLLGCK